MKTFAILAAMALTLVAGPAIAGVGVSAEPHSRVVLGVDGIGQTRNLPILVAERLGYFRDEGLTVTLVDSPGEPTPRS